MTDRPIMYSEVIDAVLGYFDGNEEVAVDCLRYLANLQYNNTWACQLGVEANYKINQMGRCERCGEKFQLAHYKEYHDEVDAYEDMTEVYCPNCDIGHEGEEYD